MKESDMEIQQREWHKKNREYEQGKEEKMRWEIYACHEKLCMHVIIHLKPRSEVVVCGGDAQVCADGASIYAHLPYWIIIWLSQACVGGKQQIIVSNYGKGSEGAQ